MRTALLWLEKWTVLRDVHLLPNALRGMFLWARLIYRVIVGAVSSVPSAWKVNSRKLA
jgi:hypothetical protein